MPAPSPTYAPAGALLWWLWRRKLARDGAAKAPPAFTFDGKELKKSPPPVRRTHSVNSLDLEGAYTPRYRQPITPRRAALKQSGYGATISVHASAGGGGKQLASGVQLLPRAPGAGGARMPVSMARTMAAVAGMQEARRAGVQAERYASQQAAEQAAMREYLKSKPPQVGGGGVGDSWQAQPWQQLAGAGISGVVLVMVGCACALCCHPRLPVVRCPAAGDVGGRGGGPGGARRRAAGPLAEPPELAAAGQRGQPPLQLHQRRHQQGGV